MSVHISDGNSSDDEDVATDQGERGSETVREMMAALEELDRDAAQSHHSGSGSGHRLEDTEVFDLMDGRVELGPPVTVSNRDGVRIDRAHRPHMQSDKKSLVTTFSIN